ncbi:hypothetical protein [Pseudoxanthomonas winnipegensis]|nr:hypothetical protein [Pseudoxanthomonas winnipegensis]
MNFRNFRVCVPGALPLEFSAADFGAAELEAIRYLGLHALPAGSTIEVL